MLRLSSSSLLKTCRMQVLDTIYCSPTMPAMQVQSVRFRKVPKRKPSHLGTAKSKLFRFPKHVPYAEGEDEELKKLYNDYRHSMKSIVNYFKEELAKTSDTSKVATERQKAEEENHIQLMEENRLENERIVKMRAERLKEELKVKRETVLNNIIAFEEKQQLELQEMEEVVRREKELAKSFITLETLDDAIEKALQTEVDYNFALDLQGNVYKGRRAKIGSALNSE